MASSANLSRLTSVILIIAAMMPIVTALAWTGDRVHSPVRPGPILTDTMLNALPRQPREKESRRAGRLARELDLRVDAEDPQEFTAEG